MCYVPKQHAQGGNVAYAANFWKKIYYYYYYYYYHYYYWGNKLQVENEIEKAHFETSLLIFCWLIRWLVWQLSWVQGMSQEETETIQCEEF